MLSASNFFSNSTDCLGSAAYCMMFYILTYGFVCMADFFSVSNSELWIILEVKSRARSIPVDMDLQNFSIRLTKILCLFSCRFFAFTIISLDDLPSFTLDDPKRLPAQRVTHIFDCCVCRRMWFNNCSDNQWRIGDDFISCSKFGGGYHSSKFDCNVEFILLDWFSQGVRTPWFSRVSVIDTKSDMQCYSQ